MNDVLIPSEGAKEDAVTARPKMETTDMPTPAPEVAVADMKEPLVEIPVQDMTS